MCAYLCDWWPFEEPTRHDDQDRMRPNVARRLMRRKEETGGRVVVLRDVVRLDHLSWNTGKLTRTLPWCFPRSFLVSSASSVRDT